MALRETQATSALPQAWHGLVTWFSKLVALGAVAVFALAAASCGVTARPRSTATTTITTGGSAKATTTVPRTTTSQPTPRAYEESLGARPTPGVVGESLTGAQAGLVAAGFTVRVRVTAEVADPTAPAGTVVSQTPPAGTLVFTSPPTGRLPSPSIPAHLAVTIAVPRSATCTAAQLGVTYRFDQGSTGSWYAGVVVRNRSSSWCEVPGTATLVGLGPTGEPDTGTVAYSLSNPAMDVLSPDTPPPGSFPSFTGSGVGETYPVGVIWERLGFSSPDGANCTEEVTPAPTGWRVTMPGVGSLTGPDGTASVGTTMGSTWPFPPCAGKLAGTPTPRSPEASVI